MDNKKEVALETAGIATEKNHHNNLPSWDELKYFVRKYYLFLLVIALIPVTLYALGQQLANRSSAAPLLKLGTGSKVGVQGGTGPNNPPNPSPELLNNCTSTDGSTTYELGDYFVGSCGTATVDPSECKQCYEVLGYNNWSWKNVNCYDIPSDELNNFCPASCPAGGGGSITNGGYGWFQIDKDCRQCRNGSWSKKLEDTNSSNDKYDSQCPAWNEVNPAYNPAPAGGNQSSPEDKPPKGKKSPKESTVPKCGVGSAYGCVGVIVGGDCDPQVCPGFYCFKNLESGGVISCGRDKK